MADIKKDVIEKSRKAENVEEVETILKENNIKLEDRKNEEFQHSLNDVDLEEIAGGIRTAPAEKSRMP